MRRHTYLSLAALLLVTASLVSSQSTRVVISGTGASFPSTVYKNWAFFFRFVEPNTLIEYEPIGSTGGRKAILSASHDFAGSDVPMSESERFVSEGTIFSFPSLVAAIGLPYNPVGIGDGVVFSRSFLVRVFSPRPGERTPFWNDPEIQALNPTLSLPNARIKLVVRDSGSGTTKNTKLGVKRIAEHHELEYHGDTSSGISWPHHPDDIVIGKGTSGTLGLVQTTEYALGYASAGDAHARGLPLLGLQNTEGTAVFPDEDGVADAANSAVMDAELNLETLDPAPDGPAWPLTVATYLLMERAITNDADNCNVPRALVRFFSWVQTNELAIEDAKAIGSTMPFKVLRKVLQSLQLKVTCNNIGAADGVGHVLLAGGSFPTSPLQKLANSYSTVDAKHPVLYDPLGSGTSTRLLLGINADLVFIEAPISDEDIEAQNLIQAPVLAGPVVPIVNLPELEGRESLVLSLSVLVGIFQGDITKWDDPRIQRENRNSINHLPSLDIKVAVRCDSSGTTRAFTDALVGEDENFTPGAAKRPSWPESFTLCGSGNSGLAGVVTSTPYSIGYISIGTALSKGIPVPRMLNNAGNIVSVGTESVQAAGADFAGPVLDEIIDTGRGAFVLSNSQHPQAWPIMATIYVASYAKTPENNECEAHAWALNFLTYVLTSENTRDILATTFFTMLDNDRSLRVLQRFVNTRCGSSALDLGPGSQCPVVNGGLCNAHGECIPFGEKLACACSKGWDGKGCENLKPNTLARDVSLIILGVLLLGGLFAFVVYYLIKRGDRPPVWLIPRDEFSIEDLLGQGGNALVFLATWKATRVAVKVVPLIASKTGSMMTIDDVLIPGDALYQARQDQRLEGKIVGELPSPPAEAVTSQTFRGRNKQPPSTDLVTASISDSKPMQAGLVGPSRSDVKNPITTSPKAEVGQRMKAGVERDGTTVPDDKTTNEKDIKGTDDTQQEQGPSPKEEASKASTQLATQSGAKKTASGSATDMSKVPKSKKTPAPRSGPATLSKGKKNHLGDVFADDGGWVIDMSNSESDMDELDEGGEVIPKAGAKYNLLDREESLLTELPGTPSASEAVLSTGTLVPAGNKPGAPPTTTTFLSPPVPANRGRRKSKTSNAKNSSSSASHSYSSRTTMRKVKRNSSMVNEVSIIARLRHPNVAFLIAASSHKNYFYLLMELMDAGSCYEVLRNNMLDLSPSIRAGLACDSSAGLLYLHSQTPPVLHMDLKTPNILVDSHFVAKLTDFGLSSVRSQVVNQGTMAWTAPEVLAGEKYTTSSDVYSFGIVLWELQCLEALAPWEGMSPEQIRDAVLNGRRPPLSDDSILGPKYASLIRKCWSQLPQDRPDMDYIFQALKELRGEAERLDSARAKDGRQSLLYLDLPGGMREEILRGAPISPVPYDAVTLIFTDIVGFTKMSSEKSAEEVGDLLSSLHDAQFDKLVARYGAYHIESIGDAYICATSFPRPDEHHALHAVMMGYSMTKAAEGLGLKIRVGIHTGPAVATIVGKTKPKLTLLGDTVNAAARMEQVSPPGKVTITRGTLDLIDSNAVVKVAEGKLENIKGKGQMRTYQVLDVTDLTPKIVRKHKTPPPTSSTDMSLRRLAHASHPTSIASKLNGMQRPSLSTPTTPMSDEESKFRGVSSQGQLVPNRSVPHLADPPQLKPGRSTTTRTSPIPK